MPPRFMKILWPDPGYANTADFVYPLHRPMPRSRWIGERAEAKSGVIDTWEEATYEELEGEFRYIPAQAEAGATGYHGAAGIKALFAYAQAGGVFQLWTDRTDIGTAHTCQLVEGTLERGDSKLQMYTLTLRVRDIDGTEFVI